jgi:nucleoside-diphosphate-sugar epimerase
MGNRPNVLITGISGKIGQALVRAHADEWNISGLDMSPGPGVQAANISDWDQVDRVFNAVGDIDYVVHLAAVASSRALWDDVFANNIIGTRHVFERSKNHGVKKVLFASSWHVVGGYEKEVQEDASRVVSIDEPIRPDSDYGTSKAFGEALARQYWEQHGLRSVCLRIGNIEANDRPRNEFAKRIWLSHRDMTRLVAKSLQADIDFGLYYATSGNSNRFLDLSVTERDLGYVSEDDSAILVQ